MTQANGPTSDRSKCSTQGRLECYTYSMPPLARSSIVPWFILTLPLVAFAAEPDSKSATRNTDRRPPHKSAAQAKKDADRAKWLERLKARGVEAWPENETDEEHAATFKKSREMAADVISLFPGSRLHETQHFLFVSNIPPQQVGPYIASLDRMYEWMCKLYGVPRTHKVWLGGKAPIFAFLEKEQFDNFEDRFFPEARIITHTRQRVRPEPSESNGGSCYRLLQRQ